MWLLLVFWFLLVAVGNVTPSGASRQKESTCSYETDSFSLWWTYDAISNDVIFKMVTRSKLNGFWTGFFLGDEQPMDALGAFVRDERVDLMDGHVTNNGVVQMDNITNIQYMMFDKQEHSLVTKFSRPLTRTDSSDADLSRCITFFFPSEAVKVDDNGQVMVPQRLTRRRVCSIDKTCSNHHTSFVKRAAAAVCEYRKGGNTVTWNAAGDNVEFLIEQDAKRGKWWSGIGIGKSMKDMKAAVAFLENGVVKTVAGCQTQGYGMPKPDPMVNPVLNKRNSKVRNGRSFVNFAIPKRILDLYSDNTGCVPLQMAVLAAQWTDKYEMKVHEKTPESVVVCGIEHCADTKTGTAFAIESEPESTNSGDVDVSVRKTTDGNIAVAFKLGNNTNVGAEITFQGNTVQEASGEGFGEEESSGVEEGSAEIEVGEDEGEGELSSTEEHEMENTNETSMSHEIDIQAFINGQGKETGSSASTVSRAPIGTPLVITKTLTNEVTKIIQSGCDKDHMDLFICENYFNNYLFEVSTWAKAHDQALEDHMWKACMLLSLVERVPSACCTKFQNTCTSFLEFISRRM